MPEVVYQVMTLLCGLVTPLPIGTNLGLLHLLWMLVSGRLLGSRGALLPGLSAAGLTDAQVRRAWAALGQGTWTIDELLARWQQTVEHGDAWQPHGHGGYQPVAADITAFWRPRLRGCPTVHFHGQAGKSLPAIPIGIVARVGRAAGQRLALPLARVRADLADPSPRAHRHRLVRAAVLCLAPEDVLVVDREFGVALLHEVGVPRFVARLDTNFTARRATPPPYSGRGRRPTRGLLVRPLPRQRQGRHIAATPPDEVTTWTDGATVVRAEVWTDLVVPDAAQDSPTVTVIALHDPRHPEPLLLATPLALAPAVAGALYGDRWPIEQIPLAAKQMLGAARQFVHEAETCQRLPELAVLAGAIVSHAATVLPAVPTGYWDRQPRPTPGRLRRVLGRAPFPQECSLPARLREKASRTDQLPKGWFGQRRPTAAPPIDAAPPARAA